MTGDELARVPNLGRCELVVGRVVHMSPTGFVHGKIEARFAAALCAFVEPRGLGEGPDRRGRHLHPRAIPTRCAVPTSCYISNERLARKTPGRAFLDVAPELVIEVLSPDDRPGEIRTKLAEYFEAGVKVVWLARPDERDVLVHRSVTDFLRVGRDEILTATDVLPGLALPLAEIFRD